MAKKIENTDNSLNDKVKKALTLLNKQFGEGSAMTFSNTVVVDLPRISSGSISLDYALGGGFPLGRISEVFGPESSGKSTIGLHVCAEAQKIGKTVAYLDLENAIDIKYAKALGVDINNLIFSQPGSLEDAFNMMVALLENKLCDVIIFDSVAAGRSKAEISETSEVGDNFIGVHARIMSQALRKITPLVNQAQCACIFINQIRMKIGVMFGNPETTSGGSSLPYYSSIRLRIAGKKQIQEGKGDNVTVTARETEVKVIKNKTAAPFKTANFIIRFGVGIDKVDEVLTYATKFGIVEKAGAWFKYRGENVAQGREKALLWLKSNPDLIDGFTKQIKEIMNNAYEDDDSIIQVNEDSYDVEEDVKFDPETGEILE